VAEKVIIPRIERVGSEDEDSRGFEAPYSEEISSRIGRSELGQLIILNEQIAASDLSESEKAKRFEMLDKISLNLTGREATSFGYYFPNEMIAVARKEGYREVDLLDDIGKVDSFQLIPGGKILLRKEDSSVLIDQNPRKKLPLEETTYDKSLVGFLPDGGHFSIRPENDPDFRTVFCNTDRDTSSVIMRVAEGVQFIEKNTAIVKILDGFYLCKYNAAANDWERKKIIQMEQKCSFRVFSDRKMIVYVPTGNRLMTFDLDENYEVTITSDNSSTPIKIAFDRSKDVSGTEIATSTTNGEIVLWHLRKSGKWESEHIYSNDGDKINDFKILPDNRIAVFCKPGVLEIIEYSEGYWKSTGNCLKGSVTNRKVLPDSFQVSPDGRIFVLFKNINTKEGFIKIFDGTPVEEENG